MKVICGLGNPGGKYEKTRHNIGWMVADNLAKRVGSSFSTVSGLYYKADGFLNSMKVAIIKPITFMNLSGRAVRKILTRNGSSPEDLFVIHDDLDIEFGRVKLKISGGHGGHNGIRSICSDIGSKDFNRIRIGIGRDNRLDPATYVLKKFNKEEFKMLDDIIDRAADATEAMIDDQEKAMAFYNSIRL